MSIGNVERNQHTKFHRPSSILNMKKIGGTKATERKKKIHFWLQIGRFRSPVKSKVFRISACGFQHRVEQNYKNRMRNVSLL